MAEWDPWVHLEERTRLRVLWGDLPHTNGANVPSESVIVMRSGQTRSEERSALSEELGHHELGHVPVDDETEVARTELRARQWASTRLINIESLALAIVGATSLFDVADALEVEPDLLELRVRDMTAEERAAVVALVDEREMDI